MATGGKYMGDYSTIQSWRDILNQNQAITGRSLTPQQMAAISEGDLEARYKTDIARGQLALNERGQDMNAAARERALAAQRSQAPSSAQQYVTGAQALGSTALGYASLVKQGIVPSISSLWSSAPQAVGSSVTGVGNVGLPAGQAAADFYGVGSPVLTEAGGVGGQTAITGASEGVSTGTSAGTGLGGALSYLGPIAGVAAVQSAADEYNNWRYTDPNTGELVPIGTEGAIKTSDAFSGNFATDPFHTALLSPNKATAGEQFDATVGAGDWSGAAKATPGAMDYWVDPLRGNMGYAADKYLGEEASWAVNPVGKVFESVSTGTVICSELHRQGFLPSNVRMYDAQYGATLDREAYQGYLTIFSPVARRMATSRLVTAIMKPIGLATAYEMAHRKNPEIEGNILGKIVLKLGLPICRFVYRMTHKMEVAVI